MMEIESGERAAEENSYGHIWIGDCMQEQADYMYSSVSLAPMNMHYSHSPKHC